jgi:lysophospholipase L1-like esterase
VKRSSIIAMLLLTLCCAALAADKKASPVLAPITDDPKLPRVLLIGDSISMGYTLQVRELLRGKANLHRPTENCGDTARGLQKLATWLGDKKWDVIHFNFGLHDLKYLDASGKLTGPDKGGKQVASTEQYEKNLRALVAELKKTGAKLIFATTTPVPDDSAGRMPADAPKYNDVARKVMTESGVEIDDLYGLVQAHPTIIQHGNVHYAKEGYQVLAEQVAQKVVQALGR